MELVDVVLQKLYDQNIFFQIFLKAKGSSENASPSSFP